MMLYSKRCWSPIRNVDAQWFGGSFEIIISGTGSSNTGHKDRITSPKATEAVNHRLLFHVERLKWWKYT